MPASSKSDGKVWECVIEECIRGDTVAIAEQAHRMIATIMTELVGVLPGGSHGSVKKSRFAFSQAGSGVFGRAHETGLPHSGVR